MRIKTLILTVAILTGTAMLGAACQQQTVTTNQNTARTTNQTAATNQNAATMQNHNAMNHGSTNNNSTDHAAMNHSTMQSLPGAASQPFDLQFLDTMIAHHQGAVDMAKMAIEKTQNAELKQFAEKIIADQNREIAQMKEWRDKWYAGKPQALNMEMPGMADSMKMMSDGEMKRMKAASGNEFDLMFLDMMTPHHAGATRMAQDALARAEHSEIKTLAQTIIREQEKEIRQMQEWKTKWTK